MNNGYNYQLNKSLQPEQIRGVALNYASVLDDDQLIVFAASLDSSPNTYNHQLAGEIKKIIKEKESKKGSKNETRKLSFEMSA